MQSVVFCHFSIKRDYPTCMFQNTHKIVAVHMSHIYCELNLGKRLFGYLAD